ncbi:MAG: Smr/MutS family protein, partial [Bartonella sp.]|nr:Smr/MutS family protein [Bartonella sp.]
MQGNVGNTKNKTLQALQIFPLSQESQQKQKPTIVRGQKKKIIKAKKMHCFDHTVHRKIAKGVYRIEARIDLHGLIQDEAYRFLKEFLQSSHQCGLRYVLVITGKGRSQGSNGILCQFVSY